MGTGERDSTANLPYPQSQCHPTAPRFSSTQLFVSVARRKTLHRYMSEGNMKRSIESWLVLLIFTLAFSSNASSQEKRLVGIWECYKQEDKAKAPSCFYSLELREDGTMISKGIAWGPGQVIEHQHKFSATSKRIEVTDVESDLRWYLDYKFLKNGDLFVYKPPWDFRGWFTMDTAKVPNDHGCRWGSPLPNRKKGQ
jgi:hypothetical protein